jgi:hypothetical protein
VAYSRWSSSVWYTYWSVYDTDGQETLKVCGGFSSERSFTYQDLKDDIDACVKQCAYFAAVPAHEPKKFGNATLDALAGVVAVGTPEWRPTEDELAELKGYMCSFILEVELSKTQTEP